MTRKYGGTNFSSFSSHTFRYKVRGIKLIKTMKRAGVNLITHAKILFSKFLLDSISINLIKFRLVNSSIAPRIYIHYILFPIIIPSYLPLLNNRVNNFSWNKMKTVTLLERGYLVEFVNTTSVFYRRHLSW